MTPADTDTVSRGINAINKQRTQRAEAVAHVVLAVVLGIIGAALLVHYLTPCDAGHLCSLAVVTPTRSGPLSRLLAWMRAAYLRRLICSAEDDIEHMQHAYESLPAQMASHRIWLDHRRVRLIELELQTRQR